MERQLPLACLVSLAVFALAASAAIGPLNGLVRVVEYLGIFSLTLIPQAYAGRPRHLRGVLLVALAAALVLSATVQVTSPTVPAQYLSNQESQGAVWIRSYQDNSVVVFTDFRLAGPLIAVGYLRVVGISDSSMSTAEVNRLLDEIYYSADSCSIGKGLSEVRTSTTNQSYQLFMVSTRMSATFPGIKGYNYNFQPAPLRFIESYAANPALDSVYDNGEVHVYSATGLESTMC